MAPTLLQALALLLTGSLTGMLGSMLGVGGGVFLVPALVILFDVPMHFAVGTSLVVVIATSSAVGAFRNEREAANVRLALVLQVVAIAAAILGGLVAGAVPERQLVFLFGLLLLPVGLLMWRQAPARDEARDADAGAYYVVRRLGVGVGVSGVAGVVSGLLGVGGGILMVPALTLFCRVPTRAAIATSNFMIGITALASTFLYFGRGEIAPALTGAVVLGVLIGSTLGIRLARRLSGSQVRRVFAVFLWFVASQMLWRAVRPS